MVEAGTSAQGPLFREFVGCREAWGELLPELPHLSVVSVAVHTDTGRKYQTLVGGGIVGREESPPAEDVE